MVRFFIILLFTVKFSFSGEKVFTVMGTYLIVDTPAYQYDIYRYVSHLENLLSDYREESEISKINLQAGKGCVQVSEETKEVLEKSIEVSNLTSGAFDITVGAITINHRRKGILSFEKAKELVNYRDLKVEGNHVCLQKEWMAVDLGGIGKGYAVQKVYERFRDKVKRGFVAIAGDMKVWGHRRTIGIYNPLTKGVLAKVENKMDVCISTSGNYFQDHIVGNQTEIVQITVAGDECSYVDGLSTGLFGMERQVRDRFLRENDRFGILILYKDGSVWFNRKFSQLFKILFDGE